MQTLYQLKRTAATLAMLALLVTGTGLGTAQAQSGSRAQEEDSSWCFRSGGHALACAFAAGIVGSVLLGGGSSETPSGDRAYDNREWQPSDLDRHICQTEGIC